MQEGRLIIFQHNEVRDKLTHLATSPPQVTLLRTKSFGPQGNQTNMNAPCKKHPTKMKEKRGMDCILDIHVTDTDAKSYCKWPPAKVIKSQEKKKQLKHLERCHFTPFGIYVDGLLGQEAAPTFSKQLVAKVASKWQHTYSKVCGYVNA
jgi:hypothetical protein